MTRTEVRKLPWMITDRDHDFVGAQRRERPRQVVAGEHVGARDGMLVLLQRGLEPPPPTFSATTLSPVSLPNVTTPYLLSPTSRSNTRSSVGCGASSALPYLDGSRNYIITFPVCSSRPSTVITGAVMLCCEVVLCICNVLNSSLHYVN
jgi:hypothetical protein